jgi:hypothetical protein
MGARQPEPLAVIYRTDQKLTPVMENFIKALKQPVPVEIPRPRERERMSAGQVRAKWEETN